MAQVKRATENTAMALFAVAAFGIAALIVYWAVFEPSPISNVHLESPDSHTWAGGGIKITYTADVFQDCPGYTDIIVTASDGKVFTDRLDFIKQPGAEYLLHLPQSVAPGRTEYREVSSIRCNPLRAHTVESNVIEFHIVSSFGG